MNQKLQKFMDKEGASYWELRSEESEVTSLAAWNNNLKKCRVDMKIGHSLRLLYKNCWSFIHFEDEAQLLSSAEKAIKFAKKLNDMTKTKRRMYHSKQIVKSKKTPVKIDPRDISIEEKKRLVLSASKKPCKYTNNSQIVYFDNIRNLNYTNSDGSCINQELIYTYCGASMIVNVNNVMESFDIRNGALRGYEVTNSLPELAKRAHKKALQLTKAVVPKSGIYPVVSGPGLTDVFIHEALGHAAEADCVQSKDSCLIDKMGEKIASSVVNVYDDSTVKGSWGSFFYDDEGIPAQKTQLIKNGKLVSFLHSRETAALMNSTPTGNARAQGVSNRPQVRMSNTDISTGKYSKSELFEGIKLGVYLSGSRGGQVDTAKGSFQFSAQEGRMIRNGKLAERLRGVSLTGKTLDILQKISKISNKCNVGFPGFCGKGGQSVPVIGHCPDIFIKKAMVGGK